MEAFWVTDHRAVGEMWVLGSSLEGVRNQGSWHTPPHVRLTGAGGVAAQGPEPLGSP